MSQKNPKKTSGPFIWSGPFIERSLYLGGGVTLCPRFLKKFGGKCPRLAIQWGRFPHFCSQFREWAFVCFCNFLEYLRVHSRSTHQSNSGSTVTWAPSHPLKNGFFFCKAAVQRDVKVRATQKCRAQLGLTHKCIVVTNITWSPPRRPGYIFFRKFVSLFPKEIHFPFTKKKKEAGAGKKKCRGRRREKKIYFFILIFFFDFFFFFGK